MSGRAAHPTSPLLDPGSGLSPSDGALVRRLTRAEADLIAGLPSDDPKDPKRRARVAHTADEIAQQPDCIAKTQDRNRMHLERLVAELVARRPLRIVLTGCGDSMACHIGLRALWEQATGLPVIPVQALDLAYYPGALMDARTVVIAASSSGVTPRTVEALLIARRCGAATVALTNTPGSAICEIADHTLEIVAARKGWPTQASTAAMAAQVQLAEAWGVALGRPALVSAGLADLVTATLAAVEQPAAAVGRRLSGAGLVHLCGGGPALAVAMFGAAKIKECTSGHALAHPLEEVHHYTSVKPGETMVIVAPEGPSRARAADTARQVRAWGGQSVGVLSAGDAALAALCDTAVFVPEGPEALAAVSFTVPLQVMALHMALEEFARADNG